MFELVKGKLVKVIGKYFINDHFEVKNSRVFLSGF